MEGLKGGRFRNKGQNKGWKCRESEKRGKEEAGWEEQSGKTKEKRQIRKG